MNIRTREATVAGVTVVEVEGIVDLATLGTLHDALARAIRTHPGATAVVDLDGVVAIDDSGLGVLLGAAALAREHGGDVELLCSTAPVIDRIRATRLDRAISMRATATG